MSTFDFGDFEEADRWDATPTIAPEQVARRLHRLRRAVQQLAGRDDLGSFDDLSRRDRDAAEQLGQTIAEWVETHEPDNPAILAQHVHDTRVFDTGGVLTPWDQLPASERQIGIDLIRLVTAWLSREGPR